MDCISDIIILFGVVIGWQVFGSRFDLGGLLGYLLRCGLRAFGVCVFAFGCCFWVWFVVLLLCLCFGCCFWLWCLVSCVRFGCGGCAG